jgi:hypothetical protein
MGVRRGGGQGGLLPPLAGQGRPKIVCFWTFLKKLVCSFVFLGKVLAPLEKCLRMPMFETVKRM